MDSIDFTRIQVSSFNGNEDLKSCDFRDNDESIDSLGVDNFIRYRASAYQELRLCVVYLVRYNEEIVGFFTLSMGAIEVKKLEQGEGLDGAEHLRSYPGLFLGNTGVDKKFRRKGIGKWICEYCVRLAVEWSKIIGCGYVFLETNSDKKRFYERAGFFTSGIENKKGKIWMYKRIFQRNFVRTTSDSVQVYDSVQARLDKDGVAFLSFILIS